MRSCARAWAHPRVYSCCGHGVQTAVWGSGGTSRSTNGAFFDNSGGFRFSDPRDSTAIRGSKVTTVTVPSDIKTGGCDVDLWRQQADAAATTAGINLKDYTFRCLMHLPLRRPR